MKELSIRFPGGKPKALTLSYDDGVEQDARLLQLMQAHGVKGTFNLNSGEYAPEGHVYPAGTIHRRMSAQATHDLFCDSGMEVAVHGLLHPFLERLPAQQCLYEVMADRANLEKQFGTIVRGMAYPYGTFSDTVVAQLAHAGIAYARTVIASEGFALPQDWLRLEATCHHNHPKLFELAEQFVEGTVPAQRDGWLFYLWGHSYEFEADGNWDRIEAFLDCVSGREDVWYATNIEVYDYVKAFEALRFTLDGSLVHNPTATDVWFVDRYGTTCCVKAGETCSVRI